MPVADRETREQQEPVTMPPTAAESRIGRIILIVAVLLGVGMLALGIGSWLTRGRPSGNGAAVTPTSAVAPTQAASTAATATPAPALATTIPLPSVTLTVTTRPATAAATPALFTPAPATATRVANSGATATPDLSGPGHVPEPDPAKEAERRVVATIGDGGLGDRVAGLLNKFYPLITRAYAENNPELLRPFLTEDAYEGYARGIKRTNADAEAIVPVYAYRIQPKVLSNGQNGYAVNVAAIRYDRDVDTKTRQVLRVSKPFRECDRWYLTDVGGALRIEGSTVIPERFCDAGWPDPPTPTKE